MSGARRAPLETVLKAFTAVRSERGFRGGSAGGPRFQVPRTRIPPSCPLDGKRGYSHGGK